MMHDFTKFDEINLHKSINLHEMMRMKFNFMDLSSSNGREWENKADIHGEIVNFFRHLYSCDHRSRPWMGGISFKQISNVRASFLENWFAKEEMREAIFSPLRESFSGP